MASPIAGAGDPVAKYCAAIKVADAQPLAKGALAAAQVGPDGCTFILPGQDINGDNITVAVSTDDSSKSDYNSDVTGPISGTPNPLAGLGDVAVWEQPGKGDVPFVVAHQGSLTCEVQPPNDPGPLTIGENGSGVIGKASPADAAAYAAKLGVLCKDVFAVAGG